MQKCIKAVVSGLHHGGAKAVYNFPGFHSHEIAEGLGMKQVSLNERAAYSEAYGSAVAGIRSVVTFKSVGMNIAADAFLHSLIGGINAGLVVIVTDDTRVVGSQEFQDSRHYFDFYGGLWLEPKDIQQAYDMAREAFTISEQLDIPVVIRLTGAYFDSGNDYQELVELATSTNVDTVYIPYPAKYVVHPFYFTEQEERLSKKIESIQQFVDTYSPSIRSKYSNGALVVGAAPYTKSDDEDVLHLCTLPLPTQVKRDFARNHSEITVVEDGDSYVHEKVVAASSSIQTRSITAGSRGAATKFEKWDKYEDIFTVIKAKLANEFITGDITQFTVETTNTIGIALSFGVAISTAIGASLVRGSAYAIVGDTSFLHEGRGILEEATIRGVRLGVIIIDNGISWCTGGQTPADKVEYAIELYPSKTIDLRNGGTLELDDALREMKSSEGLYIVRLLVPDIAMRIRS